MRGFLEESFYWEKEESPAGCTVLQVREENPLRLAFPVSQKAPSLSGKGTYQQRRITLSSLLLRVSPFLFHSSFTERTLQHQAWQPVVISLLFTASAAHIRVVLIASHPASTKHSSRSSFASFFMSTTHH